MAGAYAISFLGFWCVLLLLLGQWLVASTAKSRQPGAVPGKIDLDLSHDSFVFRTHRTFMNSLENMPLMLGTFFLAVFAGVNPTLTASCVWLFFLARVVHTVLYYAIKTEKNPSPRSYFFALGLLANCVLLGAIPFSIH